MKMVVVGGNSRNIGKTSVVAGIISALPHRNWTAIKLTQFGNSVCSVDGQPCDCAPHEHPFAIQEERDRSGKADTSRFLVAGARHAWWVRVRWGMIETVVPRLRQIVEGEDNVILESNSILRFFEPNVYLSVLEPAVADFKASARKFLARADAFLCAAPDLQQSPWEGISIQTIRAKPVFPIQPGSYVTPQIIDFVESRLLAGADVSVSSGTTQPAAAE